MTKTLILAALAATSLVQPVFAEPVTQTIVVEHKDLDLDTQQGAKTLQHRVWRAVVAVCGTTSEFDIAGKNDIRQCRRDTLQVASAKADLVIADASRSQTIQVSLARK